MSITETESKTRVRNVIPDKYKNHSLVGKYDFEDYEEKTGVWNPTVGGNFKVMRPHATYYIPAYLDSIGDHDPFERFEEVTIEASDFLLVSPTKTGTHFMFEIMNMLAKGKAEYTTTNKAALWVETVDYDKMIAKFPGPRILNTHLTLTQLPPNFLRKDTKVVITMRHMKDTFVSMYHMFKNYHLLHDSLTPENEWESCFKYLLYCKGGCFGNFFEMFADAWKRRNDPNCLIVFFADLKQDPVAQVERVAKHMEVPYTPELINSVAEATKFTNMKAGKDASEKKMREEKDLSQLTVYRKGGVGDWKNHFTVAQSEEFDAYFVEWNKTRQLPKELFI